MQTQQIALRSQAGKQASRQWFEKLTSLLLQFGFQQAKLDHSMFIFKIASIMTCLLVYVDDIILARDDLAHIQQVKDFLHCKLKIKDLGQLKFFLGIEVAHTKAGIHLSQRKYAVEILREAGFENCKGMRTPMVQNLQLSEEVKSPAVSDSTLYRQLIRKLLYLTNTRPNLCYAGSSTKPIPFKSSCDS